MKDAPANDEEGQWDALAYSWDPYRLQAQNISSGELGGSGQGGSPLSTLSGDPGVAPLLWSNPKAAKLPKGPMSCQVEHCGKDLLQGKGYYQRYRVCEQHLKMLNLMVDGKPSRFCQQCGRFHDLAEFDGNKRSCRQRLQQHNARRRKREPPTRPKLSEPSDEIAHDLAHKPSIDSAKGSGSGLDYPSANVVTQMATKSEYFPDQWSTFNLERQLSGTALLSPPSARNQSTPAAAVGAPWPANLMFSAEELASLLPAPGEPGYLLSDSMIGKQLPLCETNQAELTDVMHPAAPSGTKEEFMMMARNDVPLEGQAGPSETNVQQRRPWASADPSLLAAASGSLSSYEMARMIVGSRPTDYCSDDTMTRVSIKIANCTPDKLPADMFDKLRSLLVSADSSLIQGFLRPGCTHLVLDVAMKGPGRSTTELDPVKIASVLGRELLDSCNIVVQLDDQLTEFSPKGYPYTSTLTTVYASLSSVPILLYTSPVVALKEDGSVEIYAVGKGLLNLGSKMFLRMQGGYLPLICTQPERGDKAALRLLSQFAAYEQDQGRTSTATTIDVVKVIAKKMPGPGLAVIEAQEAVGFVLSAWHPIVLLPSPLQSQELEEIIMQEQPLSPFLHSTPCPHLALVMDLGRLIDMCHSVRHYRVLGQIDNTVMADAASPLGIASAVHCLDKASRLRATFVSAGLPILTAYVESMSDILVTHIKDFSEKCGMSSDNVIYTSNPLVLCQAVAPSTVGVADLTKQVWILQFLLKSWLFESMLATILKSPAGSGQFLA